MGKAENKHPLTQILAVAVFLITIAGVLSLLSDPAKAMSDAKCEEWAQEIKARTEDLAQGQDTIVRFNHCPNLCFFNDADTDLQVTSYLRTVGQAGTMIGAIIGEFHEGGQPIGDKYFLPGFYGPTAFFCADGTAVVSAAHPAPTTCGTAFTRICTTTLSD